MTEKKFLSLLFYITLLGLCFLMANYTAGYDFDLWARLIVGKVFWATGEVLNIDGFCGGYNLQNAWSTAYVCAQNINKNYNQSIQTKIKP